MASSQDFTQVVQQQMQAHEQMLAGMTRSEQEYWKKIEREINKSVDKQKNARMAAEKAFFNWRRAQVASMTAEELRDYQSAIRRELIDEKKELTKEYQWKKAAREQANAEELRIANEKIAKIDARTYKSEANRVRAREKALKEIEELEKQQREEEEKAAREYIAQQEAINRQRVKNAKESYAQNRDKEAQEQKALNAAVKKDADIRKQEEQIAKARKAEKKDQAKIAKEEEKLEKLKKKKGGKDPEVIAQLQKLDAMKKTVQQKKEELKLDEKEAKLAQDKEEFEGTDEAAALAEARAAREEERWEKSWAHQFGATKDSSGNIKFPSFKSVLSGDAKETVKAIDNLNKNIENLVDNAAKTLASYETKVNTRLWGYKAEGLGASNFQKLLNNVMYGIGINPFVQQTTVLEKLSQLTETGIAYNVESRAYLAAMSDSIVTTFNAMEQSLLRIVRIQQQDSTLYRMGLEASLNQLFNEFFQDTSYLTNSFDRVADSLLEASSKLSRSASVEFEYQVQKWLGAMESVGVSSNFVQQIAQGIGYLGSGDVQALASNTPLQTLLAISANRAGKNYAQMLTEGLDASDVNDLMTQMVKYLITIADNTDQNNVVQKAYGGVLGLNVSDFQGIQNLSTMVTALSNISESSDSMKAVVSQMTNTIMERMSLSTMISNVMENVQFSIGANMAKNPILYGTYKAMNVLDTVAGGLQLPAISVMGNMVDLHALTSLVKLGLGGLSVITTFIQGVSGFSNAFKRANGDPLAGFHYKDTLTYGKGFTGLQAGAGKSYTETVGNASEGDMEQGAINDSMAKAKETNKKSGAEETQKEKDIYEALVKEGDKEIVSTMSVDIRTTTEHVNTISALSKSITQSLGGKAIDVNLKYVADEKVPTSKNGFLVAQNQEFFTKLEAMLGLSMFNPLTGSYDDGVTLKDAAQVIVDAKNAEDNSLNVTVKKNEQSLLDWIKQNKKGTI